jgi:hypothetical protein
MLQVDEDHEHVFRRRLFMDWLEHIDTFGALNMVVSTGNKIFDLTLLEERWDATIPPFFVYKPSGTMLDLFLCQSWGYGVQR